MNEFSDLLLRVATFKRADFFKRWTQSLKDSELASLKISERIRFCLEPLGELSRVSLPPDVRFISMLDSDYPSALWTLSHPPLGLFVSGIMPSSRTLSVVGSRKPLPYSLRMTSKFVRVWAQRSVTIISGGALGIDAEAHRACLESGGQTVAVLGGGLRRLHPRSNLDLFSRILKSGGGLISEYPPLFEPRPYTFPERNRIIAALGESLFLVQAHEKSGSLSTARTALDLGKEILVLRPPPGDASYSGAQNLIEAGAKVVTGPEDLSFDLPYTSPLASQP